MGRTPNTKINGELLDKAIKEIEGANFNQSKISTFIMNRGRTYYCECIKDGLINPEVFTRLCDYYELNKNDYIMTEEKVKKEVQKQVDNLNYENLLTALGNIDKLLREMLAQQKSTNYILGEMRNNLMTSNKNQKDILGKLENMEKRYNKYGKY